MIASLLIQIMLQSRFGFDDCFMKFLLQGFAVREFGQLAGDLNTAFSQFE